MNCKVACLAPRALEVGFVFDPGPCCDLSGFNIALELCFEDTGGNASQWWWSGENRAWVQKSWEEPEMNKSNKLPCKLPKIQLGRQHAIQLRVARLGLNPQKWTRPPGACSNVVAPRRASVALSSATHLNTAYLASHKISDGIFISDHNVADLNPQKDVMSGGAPSCDSKKNIEKKK